MPPTRETDHGDLALPKVYVTRSLPMWSILAFLFAIVGAAVSLNYQVSDLAKEQVKLGKDQKVISDDVKSIKADLEKTNRKTYELGFQHGDLNRRLMIIEEWRQRTGKP